MLNLGEHIKLLKGLPAFNELHEKDIALMLEQQKLLRVISYEPGEVIIKEHENDRRIFLMIKGKVEIFKYIYSQGTQNIQSLKVVSDRGVFVGEISALTGQPRTASVSTLERTICAVIDIELLMHTSSVLLERVKTKFYPKLFELLAKRLDETSSKMVLLKQREDGWSGKLAAANRELLTLKNQYVEEMRKKNQEIADLRRRVESLEHSIPFTDLDLD